MFSMWKKSSEELPVIEKTEEFINKDGIKEIIASSEPVILYRKKDKEYYIVKYEQYKWDEIDEDWEYIWETYDGNCMNVSHDDYWKKFEVFTE